MPHLFPGMDLKLQLAHKLQYHLLPAEVPVAAPVRIAAVLESFCHLSGDLFGWRMMANGGFLIWIVDMSGHGLETGLTSAVVKAIIDSLGDESRVHEMVSQVNEALGHCVRPGGRAIFATGFFMTLAADGTAEFCSTGHPPTLVTGSHGELRELSSNSLPIGMFTDREFVAEETYISEGDTLFLYTDGLIELASPDGESFGLRRLREVLQGTPREPKELTESIYERIDRDHDMARLEDDVTFIAAQMIPQPGS
jgi:sigma-B regulation protein RsbU (phosphoserine phosphatase)